MSFQTKKNHFVLSGPDTRHFFNKYGDVIIFRNYFSHENRETIIECLTIHFRIFRKDLRY